MPMRNSVPLVVGLVALGWTASVWTAAVATQSGAPAPAPPSAERDGHDRATPIGAAACAACHPKMHQDWTRGRHSRMVQPATAATALGDFSQTRLTLHGKPYRLRAENGQLFITESSLTGKPVEHRVEYTLGSRRIQHYLTTIDRGRIVVLPPTWDVRASRVVRQRGHHPAG